MRFSSVDLHDQAPDCHHVRASVRIACRQMQHRCPPCARCRGQTGAGFYPASAVKFNAQGRDLVSVTVKGNSARNGARGPGDLALIVDCRLRQLAASPITEVAKDGAPPTTVAGFKTSDLKPPPVGMYQRFVTALCDGELLGVQAVPAKSGWKHFLESPQRGLYFVSASVRTIGKYRAASVRLYEFGGAAA